MKSAAPFNRLCLALGLLWLLAVPFGSMFYMASTPQDFPQYYMGGVVAAHRAWGNLYPVPSADSKYNLGFEDASIIRPGYRALATEVGTSTMDVRFIQSPTVALMCVPMSWLSFETANYAWRIVLAFCVWTCAIYAIRMSVFFFAAERKLMGVVALACCVSPLAYRIVRVGNVSGVVAVCIAVTMFDLLARAARHTRQVASLHDGVAFDDAPDGMRVARSLTKTFVTACAIAFGFFLKYVTVVLIPVQLLARQWKPPLLAAVIGGIAFGATYLYIGPGAFHEFATSVAPTLSRPHPKQANQSLQGFLLRVTHQETLHPSQRIGILVAQVAVLVAIAFVMLRVPRDRWRDPAMLSAGAFAPIVWLLIFGPLFWEHYPAYFLPFAGWLAWEATRSRGRLIVVLAGASLLYVPFVYKERAWLFEPLSSHMLWGTLLLLGVAIGRLSATGQRLSVDGEVVAPLAADR